jgi:hypothetical protein
MRKDQTIGSTSIAKSQPRNTQSKYIQQVISSEEWFKAAQKACID